MEHDPQDRPEDREAAPAAASPLHGPGWRPFDVDTALLRTFHVLAMTGSFTRTAERVGRTQSAVSQQIQKLEDIVGRPLLVRSRRHVGLTTAGELLLGYARQVLDLLDQAFGKMASPGMLGDVRFGSPEDFATFFLPDILARFIHRHPSVRLRTNCELTLRLIEGFQRGEYDLVVIKQEPGRSYPGSRPIMREKLVWVGAGGDPAAGAVVDGGARLVLSPEPCVYRKRALESLDQAGVPWTLVYTSPSLAGAAAAVRARLGVTVLPRNMIPPGLLPVDGDHRLPDLEETEIGLLSRADASLAVATFAEYVAECLSH